MKRVRFMGRSAPLEVIQYVPTSWPSAVREWTALLGPSGVETGADLERYARSSATTSGESPRAVLFPKSTDEVSAIVEIAARYVIPLYPISCGKNWGYGDARPSGPGQVIVDLSRMNRVLEVDTELGYAVIEPGVTQGQLCAYLREHKTGLLADSTGAGPDASVVGNTLERGFGHTRYGDHYQHSCGMEIVLSNGQVLNTGFGHYEHSKSKWIYKYGVGPSLDGLFTQSNLGIVTKLGVWLMPEPEHFNAFFFFAREERELGELVDALGALRRQGILQSCIHIGNDFRIMSGRTQYPFEEANGITPMPEELRRKMRARHQISAWTGAGTITGTPEIVAATRRAIRRALRGKRVVFLDDRKLAMAEVAGRVLETLGIGKSLTEPLAVVRSVYDYLRGTPNYDAMRGVLWRVRRQHSKAELTDPLNTDSGLQWVSPIVPLSGREAQFVTLLLSPIYRRHGFDPLITFTMITERALCCVTNIAFDKSVPEDVRRARECYAELSATLRDYGYPLYRSGPGSFGDLARGSSVYWDVVRSIKETLDPANIMSPGRYAP